MTPPLRNAQLGCSTLPRDLKGKGTEFLTMSAGEHWEVIKQKVSNAIIKTAFISGDSEALLRACAFKKYVEVTWLWKMFGLKQDEKMQVMKC